MTEVRVAYPEDLIVAVGNYLSGRPYNEVKHLVPRLENEAVTVELPLDEPAAGNGAEE